MNKVWEETWHANDTPLAHDVNLYGILIRGGADNMVVLKVPGGSLEDDAVPKRARSLLAAQAPAMARMLVALVDGDDNSPEMQAEAIQVLKAAGVLE